MSDFHKAYQALLLKTYPMAAGLKDNFDVLQFLVNPESISLPLKVYTQVQDCVREIYHFAHSDPFGRRLAEQLPPVEREILNLKIPNASVLMAYDFHWHLETEKLTLIEINTNASNFLTGQLLYEFTEVPSPWSMALAELKNAFAEEWRSFGRPSPPRVGILDDKPLQQKLYIEFLMYKNLFASWGWPAEIYDIPDAPLNAVDFIYNRYTDFLLTQAASQKLRAAYQSGKVLFSPHPREYLLLASKDRLMDFYLDHLSPALANVIDLKAATDKDAIWADRKQLFFKPKKMFGGKAVYRGESISRRLFDEIFDQEYIAQEFRPAGTYKDWKFDLRFFVYKDKVQLGYARLYKGQVTNLQTPGGGLCRLTIV